MSLAEKLIEELIEGSRGYMPSRKFQDTIEKLARKHGGYVEYEDQGDYTVAVPGVPSPKGSSFERAVKAAGYMITGWDKEFGYEVREK